MKMEFLDYAGIWQTVDDINATWREGADNPSWYTEENGWTGSTNGAYLELEMPTQPISGDFDQLLGVAGVS